MNPRIAMPVLRQLPRDTDKPLWQRLLWWREPIIYEVVEDYYYQTCLWTGRPVILLLPAGFRCDLASTPRFSWVFGYRPDGLLLAPGLFHDFYYRHGFVIDCAVPGRNFIGKGERAFGDRLLAHMTREISGLALPGFLALAVLTLFGWPAWKHNEQYRMRAKERKYCGIYELQGEYK